MIFVQEYGPAPGMESIAERRAREAKMKEEYDRKMREIEEKKNAKVDEFKIKSIDMSFIFRMTSMKYVK